MDDWVRLTSTMTWHLGIFYYHYLFIFYLLKFLFRFYYLNRWPDKTTRTTWDLPSQFIRDTCILIPQPSRHWPCSLCRSTHCPIPIQNAGNLTRVLVNDSENVLRCKVIWNKTILAWMLALDIGHWMFCSFLIDTILPNQSCWDKIGITC